MTTLFAFTTGLFLGIFIAFVGIACVYYDKFETLTNENKEQLKINNELIEHFEVIMTKTESES